MEEIQTSISADGWTGAAMGNMWKLDSILRESLRYQGVNLREYIHTFPDGLACTRTHGLLGCMPPGSLDDPKGHEGHHTQRRDADP